MSFFPAFVSARKRQQEQAPTPEPAGRRIVRRAVARRRQRHLQSAAAAGARRRAGGARRRTAAAARADRTQSPSGRHDRPQPVVDRPRGPAVLGRQGGGDASSVCHVAPAGHRRQHRRRVRGDRRDRGCAAGIGRGARLGLPARLVGERLRHAASRTPAQTFRRSAHSFISDQFSNSSLVPAARLRPGHFGRCAFGKVRGGAGRRGSSGPTGFDLATSKQTAIPAEAAVR